MDEDIRTVWCGNLHEKVTEEILYELFTQGGPVEKVSIPKDRDGKQKSFGFVTFKHECSVPYALDLFEGTTLFKRPLNMKSRNNTMENSYQQQQQQHQQQQQINSYDSRQQKMQNDLQLGQQILLGSIAPMTFGANNMFMLPGSVYYPSQNSVYSQNPQNFTEYNRSSRQGSRNHPYQERDHYNERHNNRQESYNRDHSKSYKHSSHRSNRHDSKRKYR